jgi:hypothetical protein
MVRLSDLRTGRLYPSGKIFWFSLLLDAESPQGHSAAGRVMSMKNSSDTIGNQTRHPPACSAAPQPTAPRRAPRTMRMPVSCECCVLLGRGSCDGPLSLREKSCRVWCMCQCEHEASTVRKVWRTGAVAPERKQMRL